MGTRFIVALVTAFILFPMLGFPRAEGQSSPDPKLLDGAKKQGEMVFYTTMTLDQSKEVVDRFQKNIHSSNRLCFARGAAHGRGLCFSHYDCSQSSHPTGATLL